MEYTKALAKLIDEFRKFPGVGPKSAQRMAFAVLRKSDEAAEKFRGAIHDAKTQIHYCSQCFNLTTKELGSETPLLCEICKNPKRDALQICVIEEVKDLMALERTQEFRGHYHVLGGVISPLDGISAEDLAITELMQRINKFLSEDDLEHKQLELILALGLSTEGEATILYIRRLVEELIKSLTASGRQVPADIVKVTRLAYGLPVGADLDYADEGTLAKALEARVSC